MKALINNEISHEDFETIINEEKKYWELKESIRMMNSQEDRRRRRRQNIGINKVTKRNEIINNNLK